MPTSRLARLARLTLACLASLAALASGPSSAAAWCDPEGVTPTLDGMLGAGEYSGSSSGQGNGFAGYLGAASDLYVDSGPSGELAFALDSTGGNCAPGANDTIVIYLDALPGVGITDTTGLTDNADGGRAAASAMGTDGARADLTFPAGFRPDSALVIRTDFVGLYRLVVGGSHTFVRALSRAPMVGFESACVREVGGITMQDLGSQAGNPFRFIATLLNSSNGFRSNEFHGLPSVPGANIGVAPFAITGTLGLHFASFGPPVAMRGAFAYLDFEGYDGSGFTPTPTCGQLSSDGWAATGWSDGALAFGGTRTTPSTDYTRGATSAAVTTGGFYSFSPGGGAGRAFGIQPGGSDFAPGTLTLRVANALGAAIAAVELSYELYYRNDQGRSSSVDLSYSVDGVTFTPVPALHLETPAAAAGSGFVANPATTTITGLSIPVGGALFIRWSSADVGGSGSRDELALDDVVLRPTLAVCGDGAVNGGEACDDGPLNGTTPCGCQLACVFGSSGTDCGGGTGGACDARDTCDGTGACIDRVAGAGVVCDAADPAQACDADDVCDGTTTTCAPRFAAAGTVCDAADPAAACDVDDVCDGASLACAPAFLPAATPCRASVGACDVAESCSGSSAACPADAAAAPGTACGGAPSGVCDAQDVCAGAVGATASCEARFAPATTECRAPVGACDVAESCSGSSAACPADAAAAPGTACGGAPSGVCDAQDVCTGAVGATATCEARFAPATTECRASVGACDIAESCPGSSAACPADAAAAPGTACGGAPSGPCDEQDVCAGSLGATATCDARFTPSGTECRAAAGLCDVAETCSGSATSCPADTVRASAVVCRASADLCDAEETCDGVAATCPTDAVRASTFVCRASADLCDAVETCDGVAAACPTDAVSAAGTECRPQGSTCDLSEACDGTASACPADELDPACDCSAAVDCADSSACTTDSCDVPSGSSVGMCSNLRITGCCELDADCAEDDGDLCTVPTCDTTGMTCSEVARACDDADDCTTDACAPADGSCTFTPIPGCGVDAGTMLDAGVPADGGGTVDGGPDAGVARDAAPSVDAGGLDAGGAPPVMAGCSCRTAGGPARGGASLFLVLLVVALASRRRARISSQGS